MGFSARPSTEQEEPKQLKLSIRPLPTKALQDKYRRVVEHRDFDILREESSKESKEYDKAEFDSRCYLYIRRMLKGNWIKKEAQVFQRILGEVPKELGIVYEEKYVGSHQVYWRFKKEHIETLLLLLVIFEKRFNDFITITHG